MVEAVEYITILGIEYTMDEARNLWFALSDVFGMQNVTTCWNLIPEDTQGTVMNLLCPCSACVSAAMF